MKENIFLLLSLLVFSVSAASEKMFNSSVVAESPYQWTGIGIAESNRIFVNFPTWDVASPYQVAEVVNGKTQAYPSQAVNDDKYLAVQSVVVDTANSLLDLDIVIPQFGCVVVVRASLFLIDLISYRIEKQFVFPTEVALEKQHYFNLITANSVNSSDWHIVLEFDSVECGGMEASMYYVDINDNINILLINNATYEDITSYNIYFPDYLIDNESIGFNNQNEVIHYSGCDDAFQTHILSLNKIISSSPFCSIL